MGRHSMRSPLILSSETISHLMMVAFSPQEPEPKSVRARVILAYAGGARISTISRHLQLNRPRINRILDQAMGMGVLESLKERRGRGERNRMQAV
ncbi:MAG: hypothetical protein H6Q00_885 [Holophagaceae bacterium]|nr:hypothetical protein [Holophagaceae bacterium]